MRKSNILSRLKKLAPGACNTIGALETCEEELATSPDAIAVELARHWKNIFKDSPIDTQLLADWLKGYKENTYGNRDTYAKDMGDNTKHNIGTSPNPSHPPSKRRKAATQIRRNTASLRRKSAATQRLSATRRHPPLTSADATWWMRFRGRRRPLSLSR